MMYQSLLFAALAFTAQAKIRPGFVNNGDDDTSTGSAASATSDDIASTSASSSSLTTTTSTTGTPTSLSVLAVGGDLAATTGFAISIIDADACDTTIALRCTRAACTTLGSNNADLTITQNPSERRVAYSTTVGGLEGLVSQECQISGTTRAVCTDVISGSTAGTSTSTTITTTVPNLDYIVAPVTAGASILTTATGSCTTSPGAAAPTAGLGSVVYKVVVPVGFMAGAAALM